jgi:hypothetical protein
LRCRLRLLRQLRRLQLLLLRLWLRIMKRRLLLLNLLHLGIKLRFVFGIIEHLCVCSCVSVFVRESV